MAAVTETPAHRLRDPHVFIFSLTLLLSAALMFTLQPMVGKMLLPLVGGAPSGWLVAMSYFQIMLLAGYWVAHRLSFWPEFYHAAAVLALLAAGLAMLPVRMDGTVALFPTLPEAVRVFAALAATLTLPFLALATLSPSLQRLFANSPSPAAKNPYFLFAASNLGSFGGLLAYPLAMEWFLGLQAQSRFWTVGYGILLALCALCFVMARPAIKRVAVDAGVAAQRPSLPLRLRWLALAFVPSSLMVGVTAHITTDVGGVPFFWVLPLGLYLLTFVLAFADRPSPKMAWLPYLQPVALALFVFSLVQQPLGIASGATHVQIVLPLLVFCLCAMQCHYTLAMSRPVPQHLTAFYLWVALGGALGGIFNAFVAPLLFPLPVEFALVALLSALINPRVSAVLVDKVAPFSYALSGVALVFLYGVLHIAPQGAGLVFAVVGPLVLLFCLVGLSVNPRLFAIVAILLGVIAGFNGAGPQLRDVARNFFGVLRVYDGTIDGSVVRMLFHGSTIHGRQLIDPPQAAPNSYYATHGPAGDVIGLKPWKSIGVIGMGSAQLSCYQEAGRVFTYYEIDPNVPVMAARWFDYMRVCGTPRILVGDGRRLLAAEKPAAHDLLILDAFTSDAVPVHLMTREAVQSYFDRLTPDGLLLVHISNRFYDFRGPLSAIARELGLQALTRRYMPTAIDQKGLATVSAWVVMARNAGALEGLRERDWRDLPPSRGAVWTDDYSNLLSSLKF